MEYETLGRGPDIQILTYSLVADDSAGNTAGVLQGGPKGIVSADIDNAEGEKGPSILPGVDEETKGGTPGPQLLGTGGMRVALDDRYGGIF